MFARKPQVTNRIYLSPSFISASLVKGSFSKICALPRFVDLNECHDYLWVDSQRRSVKISAPQYVDYVFTWIQNIINDQNVFPTKSAAEFPRDFVNTVRLIFKQLFRVFAHIYTAHADVIQQLSIQGHLNSLFTHFLFFGREFDLLDRKDFAPIQDLIAELDAMESTRSSGPA
ncbi:Maintenance of ploidy protein mob2 [Phlyctochytrium planicorne]|nr:Maintenance of ploidy protein mob2 [Phlyctochytrium planicorne]